MENIRGVFILILLLINTAIMSIPLILISLIKLIPFVLIQNICRKILDVLAHIWMWINVSGGKIFLPTKFSIEGIKEMKKDASYLLISNHQSWFDIMVLERVFLGKIPFAKFFLKSELIWVPILGLAWWAMDFPFMKRYSKEYLLKHPEKKGKDLESTKKACEKFKRIPLTLVNFLEGTRYSKEKALKQKVNYKNLLKPKSGGVSLVMDLLGPQMKSIVDVTIVYPNGKITLWDYLCGRIENVNVSISYIPITESMLDSSKSIESLRKLRNIINQLWAEKDLKIELLKKKEEQV